MNKDLITMNEVMNDGKTIHLYFNQEVGLYVAYGFSAFFAAHIVDIIASFSEDMQMPVALLKKPEVSELRLSCNNPARLPQVLPPGTEAGTGTG